MLTDIFSLLLPCNGCGHGTSIHDGSGCAEHTCACIDTKERCLEKHIDIEVAEHRSSFAALSPPA